MVALIPALNEEDALPVLLDSLPDWVDPVVVDNASTDRTAERAREAGAAVVRQEERGYGAACLAGIEHLRHELGPDDVLVFVDADQHVDAGALRSLVDPVRSGRADLVLGARVDPGGGVGTLMPHARLGNRIVLLLTRLLFGRRYRDLGPFRAVRFGALLDLGMDDRTWGWTLQMQIRAVRRGMEVLEIPVVHHGRTAGRSKITGSLTTSLRVGGKMLYTLARERLRG